MAETKMTKKDWFSDLKDIVAASDFEDKEGAIEFLDKQIELLNHRAEKATERAQAKKAEGDELRKQIFSVLTDEYQTAAQIAEALDDNTISKGKILARLTQLIKAGQVEKEQIKDAEGKRAMGYKISTGEDNFAED